MKINIGADELILWLRKNKKAENETTKHLGLKILKLIKSFGGELINRDKPCYWNTENNSESIDKLELPKTASQYVIDTSKIGDIYIELSSW
tara:strand:+ start:2781 stop:3053 length:273 start_codon:yes stop_codon:yes gene_type:complete